MKKKKRREVRSDNVQNDEKNNEFKKQNYKWLQKVQ